MERRDFLKGLLAGQMLLVVGLEAHAEEVTGLPLGELQKRLGSKDSLVLFPSDAQFSAFQVSFNKRTMKLPQARVCPINTDDVAIVVKWAREFSVPFAIRGRGHSYEGYSQSNGVVIDLRLMNAVEFNSKTNRASVGAGAQLFDVYTELSKYGHTIPAGTCPPVGVSGHTLGGGFGLLTRKFGLACDAVVGLEMVNALGEIVQISEKVNPDLFWALRGGGNGSFGIVTRLIFNTFQVKDVATYSMTWTVPIDKALPLARLWQSWAPNAPDDIASIMNLQRAKGGLIRVHFAGQSTGSEKDLSKQLDRFRKLEKPAADNVKTMKYMDSVIHFGGGTGYTTCFMKAKSDYLFKPMSDDGLRTLMKSLIKATSIVGALFDAYGGAVSRIKNDATAFPHREGAQYSIQYYTQWSVEKDTPDHMKSIRAIYADMRPYVSGQCYVNYCDLDLVDGPKAYWAENLPRLQVIKAAVDPTNFFTHDQGFRSASVGDGDGNQLTKGSPLR